jgi:hypothetical protein
MNKWMNGERVKGKNEVDSNQKKKNGKAERIKKTTNKQRRIQKANVITWHKILGLLTAVGHAVS